MKRKDFVDTLTLSALFCTLICVGSLVKIPMPDFMPVTLQTFFVLLTGLVLSPKASLLATVTYAALGLIGLPVFSGGGGPGYVLMANFGFIIGFIIAATVMSVITEKVKNRAFLQNFVISLLEIAIIYVIGVFYFALITNVYHNNNYSFIWFLKTAFLPFLPKEIICSLLASVTAHRLRTYIKRIPQ